MTFVTINQLPKEKEIMLKMPFILIFCGERNSNKVHIYNAATAVSSKMHSLYEASEHITENLDVFYKISRH